MQIFVGSMKTIASTCFLVAIMVILLGAFTRLADAGLGCPDWPTCYGHLWVPSSIADIEQANQKFSDTPVETDKTWPEQMHRIFASVLGLFIIALVVVCYKNSLLTKQPLKLSILLLGLVIVQGLFGMWTVTLKLWPQVVTAHLLGGFCTLSLLWLLLQRLGGYHWQLPDISPTFLYQVRRLAVITLIVIVVQIALGGWTSSNYAALACPDLPTCQNQWLPQADFSQGFDFFQTIGPNYLGGLLESEARIAIHFSHRVGALVVSILVLTLALMLWRLGLTTSKRWSILLLIVLALQVGLGMSNIFWQLPITIAVAHNAVGALLLLLLVTINHRLYGLQLLNKKLQFDLVKGVQV